MKVRDYIRYLLSIEEYSFSLEEILRETGSKSTSLKFELLRLSKKGEIVNLRKGFYLIIPPRYSSVKKLPVQLYSEKLFSFLKRNYYIAFFSAAKFHGAGHQRVQRDYIVTERPKFNNISKHNIDIRFFTTSSWSEDNIEIRKSEAGIFRISDPALTLADLIHHQTKLGGINRILSTIEELSEELKEPDLHELLRWYPSKSTLQRMGFLFEELGFGKNFQEILFEYVGSTKVFPVLLSPRSGEKPGAVENRWKVDVNVKMEREQ